MRLGVAEFTIVGILSCALLVSSAAATQLPTTVLHSFSFDANDGRSPECDLVLDGLTLYGTTPVSGTSPFSTVGTVFKVNTDGTNFQLLHQFRYTDRVYGSSPWGGLALSATTLYGTTQEGGMHLNGTLFEINTDGSGYQVLHDFEGTSDGGNPKAQLTLVGSTLYGSSAGGGFQNKKGAIFKINTDGSGLQVLHSFAGTLADSDHPVGKLVVSGSTIFGATGFEGGKIFAVNTDGTNFDYLHTFAWSLNNTNDGRAPVAGLTLVGSTLYGTTQNGGLRGDGTVFKIDTDGSQFALLHEFDHNKPADAFSPQSSLTLVGSMLFGTTESAGTVYRIGLDGSAFEIVHRFGGTTIDGGAPRSGLIFDGSTFYGASESGGLNSEGAVYAMVIPEPSTLILALVGLLCIGLLSHGRIAYRFIRA